MTDERDPDSIQREIERTRAELAETIDEIAERLSPRRAAARSIDMVKQAVGVSAPAGPGPRDGADPTGYAVERTLRTDRVLLAVGAAATIGAFVVLRRSRS